MILNPQERLSPLIDREPVILPLHEFAIPIYQEWDRKGFPCPRHPDGWLAFNEERMQT